MIFETSMALQGHATTGGFDRLSDFAQMPDVSTHARELIRLERTPINIWALSAPA